MCCSVCVVVCYIACVTLRVVQCEYCSVCFVVCVTARSLSLLFSWASSSMCAAAECVYGGVVQRVCVAVCVSQRGLQPRPKVPCILGIWVFGSIPSNVIINESCHMIMMSHVTHVIHHDTRLCSINFHHECVKTVAKRVAACVAVCVRSTAIINASRLNSHQVPSHSWQLGYPPLVVDTIITRN